MAKRKRKEKKRKVKKADATAAKRVSKKPVSNARSAPDAPVGEREFCTLVEAAPREFNRSVHPSRVRAILRSDKKWVNATVLHYYFFDRSSDGQRIYQSNGRSQWRSWTATKAQKDVVRRAFDIWAKVGIGIEFRIQGAAARPARPGLSLA